MAPSERLVRQFTFLVECDRLKDIVRQTLNVQSGRHENDAEHSWALCLFVMTLAEYSNAPIDVLRVMKMLLIHDLVEIDAGDTFAYDTERLADQHEREALAANWIFGPGHVRSSPGAQRANWRRRSRVVDLHERAARRNRTRGASDAACPGACLAIASGEGGQ